MGVTVHFLLSSFQGTGESDEKPQPLDGGGCSFGAILLVPDVN